MKPEMKTVEFMQVQVKKMHNMTTEKLFSFIENSPTAFHAIEAMRCRLKAEGYQPLLEGSDWNLQAGGKYYVIRNGSSIIAFRIPAKEWKGFQIMAATAIPRCSRLKRTRR